MPSVSPNASSDLPRRYDRGRLMSAAELREAVFNFAVSEWWIRHNVAPDAKITLGRSTVLWYEYDVREWLLGRRSAA